MTEFTTQFKSSVNKWLATPNAYAMTVDWEKVIYAVIILTALITRLFDVGSRVVSHDESLHTYYSHQFYKGDGYSHTPVTHGPFLFHITAASYWIFGASDFSARIPVALFGVILVALPYLLRDWIGKRGALIASFALLISPMVTYYSRYIRHDIYVIVWAMIIFIASLYYLREQKQKYLWWFAGGLAMMFCTKEVAFIYIMTFGSYMTIRFLLRLINDRKIIDWSGSKKSLALISGVLIVLGGVSLILGRVLDKTGADEIASTTHRAMLLGGLAIAVLGLFLLMHAYRKQLLSIPEFDLIALYITLTLPSTAALVVHEAGFDPLDRNLPCGGDQSYLRCLLDASETAAGDNYLALMGIVLGLFALSIVAGLWWGGKKWLMPAIIFNLLFALFYTSFFTHWEGWNSGMLGSLGYWLTQHDVARGGQPWFYYLFVTSFYEFTAIVFMLAAFFGLSKYKSLFSTITLGIFVYWFSYWIYNRPEGGTAELGIVNLFIPLVLFINWGLLTYMDRTGKRVQFGAIRTVLFLLAMTSLFYYISHTGTQRVYPDGFNLVSDIYEPTHTKSILLTLLAMGVSVAYYILGDKLLGVQKERESASSHLNNIVSNDLLLHIGWWAILTWITYSIAGEKMPWLSVHMAVPMAFIVGIYFQRKSASMSKEALLSKETLTQTFFAFVIVCVGFTLLQTGFVDVDWANLSGDNFFDASGTFLGRLILLIALLYGFYKFIQATSATKRTTPITWSMAFFALLSIFTMRSTYLSSFVNEDLAKEYIVYAHGAEDTKSQMLDKLETLSMRVNGDKSMRISFDNDISWPMFWYLRDYPNNHHFGQNPGQDIKDSPVLFVGNDNWDKVDEIVGYDYIHETFTYLWWPMEDYRQFSWGGFMGIGSQGSQEANLQKRDAREAYWNIFFSRDYTQYGQTFGGDYSLAKWPLHDQARIYIRRDVLANLWDEGDLAAGFAPPKVPYEEGILSTDSTLIIGQSELEKPRNAEIGPDGNLYVADSGNHRIVVYNTDGEQLLTFGELGGAEGQFNEPWGIAVDEEFVYVADTWNHRIQKFSLTGEFVLQFGVNGITADGVTADPVTFYGPRDIALTENGELLIADTGNHRIQKIATDGTFIQTIGSQGSTIGQFQEPTSITVGKDGVMYVAEPWNQRIQKVLASNFSPIDSWKIDAWEGNSHINKPYLAVDNLGRILATDPIKNRVLLFNSNGAYLGKIETVEQLPLNNPTGITADTDGNAYIVDTESSRIVKYLLPDNLQPIE